MSGRESRTHTTNSGDEDGPQGLGFSVEISDEGVFYLGVSSN